MQYDNPYSIDGRGSAAYAIESERTAFIRRTYTHLMFAVLAFIGLEALFLAIFPAQTVMQFLGAAGNWGPLVMMVAFMAVSGIGKFPDDAVCGSWIVRCC